MKISLVTISYNQAEFLEEAILSVLNQDHPDIEYIVVDPGSTDGSREIVEKYRDRIDHIIFEPDDGPTDGLNKGFAVATGDIFGYLNSDDAFLDGAFKKVASAFQRNADADVVYGHGYIVDSNRYILRRFYSDRFSAWRYVHGGSVVMQQSTFFKNEAFKKVGGFNQDNPIWWDGELFLDFALAGFKLCLINEFLSIFRMHEESISSQKGMESERALKLDKDRQQVWARLYEKVMGHAFNKWTKPLIVLARLQKWILQPVGTIWRVIEKSGIRLGKNRIKL